MKKSINCLLSVQERKNFRSRVMLSVRVMRHIAGGEDKYEIMDEK